MGFRAVLDTTVLYPFSLRDTFLRLAAAELYGLILSPRILDEMERSLVRSGAMSHQRAERTRGLVEAAFEGSLVPTDAVDRLLPVMTNHEGDRHVLAAAVAGGAEAIITHNLKHFTAAACEPFQVQPLHPDFFLTVLFHKNPAIVIDVLKDQAADKNNPPLSLDQLLEMLDNAGVPAFAKLVREHSAEPATAR